MIVGTLVDMETLSSNTSNERKRLNKNKQQLWQRNMV